MKKKRLIILGSTGSIGTQTLEVVRRHRDRFAVAGLAANSRFDLLARQIAEFRPAMACAGEDHDRDGWQRAARRCGTVAAFGAGGLARLAALRGAGLVVNALVGAAGLEPTLAAVTAGHDVALANKETLVAGGELVMRAVRSKGVRLLPIDSEHAALHQCLDGRDPATVRRLILTASGGPFRTHPRHRLHAVRARHALRHPTWRMGQKVTIDSATLMNKGLEMIEAHHLFGVPPRRIAVVVHPESIVHSLVEFIDGSVLAQLSVPDMRLPIQYALTWPERLPSLVRQCDLAALGKLTFHAPDAGTFGCLRLAYRAIAAGGTLPAVMNAANEVAVAAFLEDRIGFLDIPRVIGRAMRTVRRPPLRGIGDIRAADAAARAHTNTLIGG
ncbi:MAG: 1-deoxy-D-xylulose-5-phosphate reductoisomerase [Candidatus Edwardsbacteria bacterium]|nr:1-deoxy-D-xylulose-5-phosphate reductoisomerase [Candidatus Edwardsbacteria bacterium]